MRCGMEDVSTDFDCSLPKAPSHQQMQPSSTVIKYTKDILEECSTNRYLIVNQPWANAGDLGGDDACSLPHLCQAVDDLRVKERFSVAEVLGEITSANFADVIKSSCAEKNRKATVTEIRLDAATSGAQTKAQSKNGRC